MLKKLFFISFIFITYFIINCEKTQAKEYCNLYENSTIFEEIELPFYFYELTRNPTTSGGMPTVNYEINEFTIDSLTKCEAINLTITYSSLNISYSKVATYSKATILESNEKAFKNAKFKTNNSVIIGLGTKKDEEPPTITGYEKEYITNINIPLNLEKIKQTISAYDNFDGNISSKIKTEHDEYTNNTLTTGDYLVILSVTDSSNNKSTITFYIKVIDTTKPKISGRNSYTSYLSSPLTIEEIKTNLTTSDNSNIDLSSQIFVCEDHYSTQKNKTGTYNIFFCVYDNSDNLSEGFKVSIEVKDDIPPTIEGLDKFNSYLSSPLTIKEILYSLAANDNIDKDVSDSIFIIEDLYSNSFNKTGEKTIYFQAMDKSNNISNPFKVTINLYDDIPPQIYGLNLFESFLSSPLSVSQLKQELTVIDNIDGNISSKLEILNDTYSNNINKKGTFHITFQATDSSLNSSQEFKISITTIDDVSPFIIGPSSLTYQLNQKPSLNTILSQYTSKDNIDTNLEITILEDNYSPSIKTGLFFITISSTDSSNNTSSPFMIKIEIVDTILIMNEITLFLPTSKFLTIDKINELIKMNYPYTIIENTYENNHHIEGSSKIIYELEDKTIITLNIQTFKEETTEPQLTNNQTKKETFLSKSKRFLKKLLSAIKTFFKNIFSLLITHRFY